MRKFPEARKLHQAFPDGFTFRITRKTWCNLSFGLYFQIKHFPMCDLSRHATENSRLILSKLLNQMVDNSHSPCTGVGIHTFATTCHLYSFFLITFKSNLHKKTSRHLHYTLAINFLPGFQLNYLLMKKFFSRHARKPCSVPILRTFLLCRHLLCFCRNRD